MDKDYFACTESRGDKFHKGLFPLSNLNPDLELQIKKKKGFKKFKFSIECKYRSTFHNRQITFDETQIKRYRKFASMKRQKVFMAIGVGGEPYSPDEVFIVPLRELKSNIVRRDELEKYKRHNLERNLFFNWNGKTLS